VKLKHALSTDAICKEVPLSAWFDGFDSRAIDTAEGVRIHLRTGGRRGAAPLLLLHGFPQTHVMWHRTAQALADTFELVLPDLRGYGDSSHPPGLTDHANYSKRAMAADMVAVMQALGHDHFSVCGHDRGGRVAHRLALDHAERVRRVAVIDICPTLTMYEATDMAFAQAYHHWFHLIQPAPLPERMIGGDPLFYLRWKLGEWGSPGLTHLEPEALAEYERCFSQPETLHAICEDYRAGASIDLDHDRADRSAGHRLACDLLVLWGERGVINRLFQPVSAWQAVCEAQVTGAAMRAGHFIPEECPQETADRLRQFFA